MIPHYDLFMICNSSLQMFFLLFGSRHSAQFAVPKRLTMPSFPVATPFAKAVWTELRFVQNVERIRKAFFAFSLIRVGADY
jgi:hypothetical protein